MKRKQKKTKKLRGSRTCGGGNTKKRRGAGNRGGRGLAGGGKNKKTKADKVRMQFPDHIGRRGFKRPQKVITEEGTINVQDLDQNIKFYLEQGIAEQEGDIITVDVQNLGITKVLGKGKVTRKLKVKAPGFSESAVRKIEEMGGTVNATE
ncbi:MAG: 50S ribosomal protein L15 [Theionarchaea archaeon]|nr:MAG: 50S ribosomal protein L15 [Theionarchaea archaeon DG-70]MBU7010676.1 50S ribosomal protein L15 [Theionarchaea archaeon]